MSYKKKKKNISFGFEVQFVLIVGWFLSYIAAFFLTFVPFVILDAMDISLDVFTGFVGILSVSFVFALFISTFHHLLMRHILHFRIPKWLLVSIIGWTIGGFLAYSIQLFDISPYERSNREVVDIVYRMLILTIPATVLQWWVLRRHVRSAWLWLLANSVVIITLTISYFTAPGRFVPHELMTLLGFLQPVLPASVMVYLAKLAYTPQGVTQ